MNERYVLDIPANAPLAVKETAKKVWEHWQRHGNVRRAPAITIYEDIPDSDDYPEIPGQVRYSKSHDKWMICLLEEAIPFSCGIECCGFDVDTVYWLDTP